MMRISMVLLLGVCLAGCAGDRIKYPSPGNDEPHAVLVLDTATSVHSSWRGSESPCNGMDYGDHAGLANVYMFHPGRQEVNLHVGAPFYIKAFALHGNCVGRGKFTPQNGKTYDGSLDNYCRFSVVDEQTGMSPPDFEIISDKEWAFKYSPSCSGARPE